MQGLLYCPGIVDTSGEQWKAQRTTALEILRELGMGKNLLAEKILTEVGEYVKAIRARNSQPFDLTRLTQISVSNNICSIVFGKHFDYDDKVICPKCILTMECAQMLLLAFVLLSVTVVKEEERWYMSCGSIVKHFF